MEIVDGTLHVAQFFAVTLGIIVLFVGKRVNDLVPLLREFSIPEPVTGGLLFSVLFAVLYATSGVAVEFDLDGTGRPARLLLHHHRHQRQPQGPAVRR